MKYLSTLAAMELVLPALSPLLATISRSRSCIDDYRHQIELVFVVLATSILPVSCLLFAESGSIVAFVLGDQWLPFSSLFGALALLSFPLCYMRLGGQIVMSHGDTKLLFVYNVLSLLALGGVLLTGVKGPVYEIAMMRLAIDVLLSSLFFSGICWYYVTLSPFRLFQLASPAVVSTAIAVYCCGKVDLDLDLAVANLALAVALYFVVYTVVMLAVSKTIFARDPAYAHMYHLVGKFLAKVFR